MSGFFSLSEIQRQPPRHMSVPGCGACKLYKNCYSPKMAPTGEGRKGILFIAEAPGEEEDRRNEQLVGKVGQIHRKICKRLGIDLDKDCRKINAINCRPVKNETPSKDQIAYCRPNILKEIKTFKPKMIIPLGGSSIYSLLAHRWPNGDPGGIVRWRGWTIPDRELGCWVCPTYHPSFVARNEGNKAVKLIYQKDLKTAFWLLKNREFPVFENEEKKVIRLKTKKEIKRYLRSLLLDPPILAAFDYEATGLKPDAEGHEIVSVAISTDGEYATAFPLIPEIFHLFIKFLKHPKIFKIAANLKFEERWSKVILKTPVVNWFWDTMIAEHCLDNRRYITGLKFQVYVHYGLMDYDSHISHLLHGTEDHANAFNRIHEIPLDDLLTYNGLDSLFEYKRAMDQMKLMGILDPHYHIKKNYL